MTPLEQATKELETVQEALEAIKREALIMFGEFAAIQEERDRMKAALERIKANWDCIDNDEDAIFNLPKGFIVAWQEAAQIAREAMKGKR